MKNISLRTRLWLPIIASLACLAVAGLLSALQARSDRMADRKAALSQLGDMAYSIAAEHAALAAAGKLSLDEAKKQATDRIAALRYGSDGYFTISDSNENVVRHAIKTELTGTNQSNFRDPAGTYVYREVSRVARESGNGFIEYLWPKPGGKEPLRKISVVRSFKPWDWNLIAGMYVDDLEADFRATTIRMFSVVALIGAALFGLVVWINRSVLASLGGEPAMAARLARSIADGDLTVDVPIAPGDHGSLMVALRDMRDGLRKTIARLAEAAASVAHATGEIASGNADLSHRTEAQASSLQQTAASMEELTSTVGLNAINAQQAEQLTREASNIAVRGGDAVGRVVETMNGIQESSRRVVDIIAVIEGIAFQTNILALNAAVEAARAGDHGRGFAVVASEVRALAHRAADSAKQIQSLINDSVSRVETGNTLVNEAGDTIRIAVEAVQQVTELMAEMATAANQQSAGIAQVNQAIGHMDSTTQQNSALVEQAAAAAQSLQDQAHSLNAVVAQFRV
ncbi:methyl-accepting chemotaxis protein [Derxia gummosa]|uniref:Methyl-accepting chemotaxis protein n=1 Tax=Derxia gummosa DSM 723 TaxID=1121388 RepID=A0A8B6X691_9BURK|nr:methyl-accepting chemotaxis protein [Derxia gummosa]